MVTCIFTQGSDSSNPNSQSTPDASPTASPNRGYNARGEITVPPFIAVNKRKNWTQLAPGGCQDRIMEEYLHQTVSIHDGTFGLKDAEGMREISQGTSRNH